MGKRYALKEWLIISGLLLSLTASLVLFHRVERIDQSLYDRFMQAHPTPSRDDIVIVNIDDYSLSQLGKWPWSRQVHAQLLKQISTAQPKAIGMDVLFSEDDPQAANDEALAQAIRASGNVVLPLVSVDAGQGLQAGPPVATIAQATKQLGHIHLEIDPDGIARSVFLKEGMNGQWWSHFSLALLERGQATKETLPGIRKPHLAPDPALGNLSLGKLWQRDYQMHIRYYGGSGHFTSVPYVAALRGEVPAAFFHNKYVLVGATALGMSDSFPTPVTDSEGVLSGVEINANILANLLDHSAITVASDEASLAYNLTALLIALLAYLYLSPRLALLATASVLLTLTVISNMALQHGYWLPPAAAIVGLLLAYPLWSWRRLEAAIRYLGEEFLLLDREPHLLPEIATDEAVPPSLWRWKPFQDKLEQRINAMQTAARRVRDLRQFVSDSINSLPDPTLVTTTDGHVLLSNPAAQHYFADIGIPQVSEALAPYLFAKMKHVQALGNTTDESFSWWHLLDLTQITTMAQGIEVRDPARRDIVIKSAPCFAGSGELSGWIISLNNISAIRIAERSRDETLHFISHDMRAPQASILALLELQRDEATALSPEEFSKRIEQAARVTLGLADNFVQLARAESQIYRLEECDFQNILLEATEEMWTLARSKRIKIVTAAPDDEYPVRVDRGLMTRVLNNLLSNAIKYSPPDTTVTCELSISGDWQQRYLECSISDQGIGIARTDQPRLFQRFQRFRHGDQPKSEGVGLGMTFVKTVIDRHHGLIDFTSVPNEGTTFRIKLPISTH